MIIIFACCSVNAALPFLVAASPQRHSSDNGHAEGEFAKAPLRNSVNRRGEGAQRELAQHDVCKSQTGVVEIERT
jgi:hypothetical protein